MAQMQFQFTIREKYDEIKERVQLWSDDWYTCFQCQTPVLKSRKADHLRGHKMWTCPLCLEDVEQRLLDIHSRERCPIVIVSNQKQQKGRGVSAGRRRTEAEHMLDIFEPHQSNTTTAATGTPVLAGRRAVQFPQPHHHQQQQVTQSAPVSAHTSPMHSRSTSPVSSSRGGGGDTLCAQSSPASPRHRCAGTGPDLDAVSNALQQHLQRVSPLQTGAATTRTVLPLLNKSRKQQGVQIPAGMQFLHERLAQLAEQHKVDQETVKHIQVPSTTQRSRLDPLSEEVREKQATAAEATSANIEEPEAVKQVYLISNKRRVSSLLTPIQPEVPSAAETELKEDIPWAKQVLRIQDEKRSEAIARQALLA